MGARDGGRYLTFGLLIVVAVCITALLLTSRGAETGTAGSQPGAATDLRFTVTSIQGTNKGTLKCLDGKALPESRGLTFGNPRQAARACRGALALPTGDYVCEKPDEPLSALKVTVKGKLVGTKFMAQYSSGPCNETRQAWRRVSQLMTMPQEEMTAQSRRLERRKKQEMRETIAKSRSELRQDKRQASRSMAKQEEKNSRSTASDAKIIGREAEPYTPSKLKP